MEPVVSILCGVSLLPELASLLYGFPSIDNLLVGHFKQNFETYTCGLESSRVYTLDDLVKFNNENADKELPPSK